MSKQIKPALGLDFFNCPSCGAHAHQTWGNLYINYLSADNKPSVPHSEVLERIRKEPNFSTEDKVKFTNYYTLRASKEPFAERNEHGLFLNWNLDNVFLSKCYSCGRFALWVYDAIVFPDTPLTFQPSPDLPPGAAGDFTEAAAIFGKSPRGAAALLRLCIQKICEALGQTDKSLDQAIAALVAQGLATEIQRALDIVRVVGNEAVHPGTMNVKDDRETATQLFELVNLIVEDRITRPKRIEALYAKLPPNKLEGIVKRDSPK